MDRYLFKVEHDTKKISIVPYTSKTCTNQEKGSINLYTHTSAFFRSMETNRDQWDEDEPMTRIRHGFSQIMTLMLIIWCKPPMFVLD